MTMLSIIDLGAFPKKGSLSSILHSNCCKISRKINFALQLLHGKSRKINFALQLLYGKSRKINFALQLLYGKSRKINFALQLQNKLQNKFCTPIAERAAKSIWNESLRKINFALQSWIMVHGVSPFAMDEVDKILSRHKYVFALISCISNDVKVRDFNKCLPATHTSVTLSRPTV